MTSNTIVLKGPWTRIEGTASAAITPGHLCEVISTASGLQFHNRWRKHATSGGNAEPIFAIEDDSWGKDVTYDYVAETQVQLMQCQPGAEVWALLADGQTAVIGSKLESNGDGQLRVVVADASVGAVAGEAIVAVALEALDLSGSLGTTVASRRLHVRVGI